MLGKLARQGPTTSNHKHIKISEFTTKVTRAVNEDYKLRAGIDDEWVYVPDKRNKVRVGVQCNEEEIDAEIDEGCVEDLQNKKCAKRTASELEESELATPEGGKKKRRGWCIARGFAWLRGPWGRWWHCTLHVNQRHCH